MKGLEGLKETKMGRELFMLLAGLCGGLWISTGAHDRHRGEVAFGLVVFLLGFAAYLTGFIIPS